MDVSVIMPAYNAEKYIGEAIESVLSQRFSGSYEILIADDASTDSTPDIIRAYQSGHPERIKAIFREKNIGANPNSYDLCLRASGRYLAFLDADDRWVSCDKLQRQFDYLEEHDNVGAVCSNAYYINNHLIGGQRKEAEGLVPFREMIDGHADIFCSSLVCRKEIYEQMAEDSRWFVDQGCFNDTVWAFWLSYHGLLFRMSEALCSYRVLSDSACHSTDKAKQILLARKYFMKKMAFLFTHEYPLEEKMKIVSQEYDYLRENAFFAGEMKVRNTRTFQTGKLIKALTSPFHQKKKDKWWK